MEVLVVAKVVTSTFEIVEFVYRKCYLSNWSSMIKSTILT